VSFEVSRDTKRTFGLALMVVGALLTASIFGMVWGIPLFMIGWDLRQRMDEEEANEAASAA
jgi:hypothetical protein